MAQLTVHLTGAGSLVTPTPANQALFLVTKKQSHLFVGAGNAKTTIVILAITAPTIPIVLDNSVVEGDIPVAGARQTVSWAIYCLVNGLGVN